MRHRLLSLLAAALLVTVACGSSPSASPTSPSVHPSGRTASEPATPMESAEPSFREFPVPARTHPHDVAPASDGRVWYTAQRSGELGVLDPATGRRRHVPLGRGSAPHGVVVGPDGAPWVTDGGLNAILRVDPETFEVSRFPLPRPENADLNTPTFDGRPVVYRAERRLRAAESEGRTSRGLRRSSGRRPVRDRCHA